MSECGLRGLASLALCWVASAAGAAEWAAGSSPVINAGETATISTPQPNIVRFTDNGTLIFTPGGSVTVTGAVVTAVGSGLGASGALDMTGGSITRQGNGFFVVGYLGATGSVTLASGATVALDAGRFRLAGNEEGQRDLPSYGEASVSGSLSAEIVEFTGFFPTNLTPPYAESAKLTLNPGGVVEAAQLQKNDCANSTVLFSGGTLRAKRDSGDFIVGRGTLALVIADGTNAVFDTNGRTVTVNPQAAPNDTVLTLRGEEGAGKSGSGGFVKTGAGALIVRLPPSCNTFTGAVSVLQGTLDLGRPLADNQRVTVSAGAHFVARSTNDFDNLTFLDGGSGARMLYTVAADTDALNLTALNALYYDDRLAGPFAGAATLSNTLTHAAGTEANPFRLIGQGGTLFLANTALESAAIQVEGGGTFAFAGPRTLAAADAGLIRITDGGYRQAGTFTLSDPAAPAVFRLPSGRFSTDGRCSVGVSGFGALVASGASVSLGSLYVGGGTGAQGSVDVASNTVNLAAESFVGADGGTGQLTVTGGQFIVNGNLRIASNPSVNTSLRPQASVIVSNALLRCNEFRITSWWPSDGSVKTLEAGLLTLLSGGVAEVTSIYKNDDPVSTVAFNGGTLRARAASAKFLNAEQAYGTLRVVAEAGQYAAIDTQGYEVAATNPPGTLAVTGPGGFKKLGSGTLTFSADHVSYAGDTRVEAGVLRLGDHNQIPHGPATGSVNIAANAVLDLNGKSDCVNRLLGLGLVLSTNAPATLGVLADGSDDTWERAWFNGAVTLDKQGAGTLTLAAAQAAPTNLTVSGGTVKLSAADGFPFYRFKIEGVKGPDTANSMQLSEIALFNDGVNVMASRVGIAYDATGGTGTDPAVNAFPAGEMPEKAVDGIVNVGTTTGNKWLDFRAKPSRTDADKARVWLRVNFGAAQRITHYNWATGNDAADRDPAAWRLQGSYDGATWTDLDVQSNYVATATRNAWVSAGGFPVSSVNAADVVGDAGLVTVRQGASLVLDGVSETVGALAGYGNVALNGAALTLATPAGTEAFFAGALSGTGDLVKSGPGTQVIYGTNTHSGATVIQAGNLLVQGIAPFRWFRFTIMKNKGNLNVTQLAEFALYGADGQRQNSALTPGASVTELAPGQFACPASYALGSPSTETPDTLFDNAAGTKWCLINNTPAVDSPSTHRTVVMRLPDGAPEITSYNLCTANDEPGRDPVTWTLEGSLDGSAWTLIDSRADVVPPSTGGTGTGAWVDLGRFVYYNGLAPYALESRAVSYGDSEGVADVIPAGSVLEVRGGATLTVAMSEGVDALRVDMLSAGTITRLIAQPNGTLYIVNASGLPAGLVLPLTLGSVENRGNLSSWSVYVNGVLQGGVTLGVDADGRLRLSASGTLIKYL